jgi:hypothetical protein
LKGQSANRNEEKGFFFEKRSKKLFCSWAMLVSLPPAQPNQRFFAPLFFKKVAAFLFSTKPRGFYERATDTCGNGAGRFAGK